MSVAYKTHQQICIPTAEEAMQQQLYEEEEMKREAATIAATATIASSPAQLKRKRASYLRNTVPRPPNAFMLFRKDFMEDLVMDRTAFYDELHRIDPEDKAKKSSFWAKTAGALWKQASRDLRERYMSKATQAKKEHSTMYPDYQYAPQRRTKAGKGSSPVQSVRAFPYQRSTERDSSYDEEDPVEPVSEDVNPLYLSTENVGMSYQPRASMSFPVPPPPEFSYSSPTTASYAFIPSPHDARFPASTGPLTPMELKFPPLPNYYTLDSPSSFTFGSGLGSYLRRPSSAFDTSFSFGGAYPSHDLGADSDALLTEYLHLDHIDSPPSFDSSSSGAGSPESYSSPSSSF